MVSRQPRCPGSTRQPIANPIRNAAIGARDALPIVRMTCPGTPTSQSQVRLDLALDYARAWFLGQALDVLADAAPEQYSGTAPLASYYRAWLCHLTHDGSGERRHLTAAVRVNPDYCFPARLEEIAILQHAIATRPRDARAPFFLGNLLYDRRRHDEAIVRWEHAVRLEPDNAVAWRNLGIAYFNIRHDPRRARAAYDKAVGANPGDARLLFERDHLWKRLGESPARRLGVLRKHAGLVASRDDLSIELCALLNQTGQPKEALDILAARRFQPWEGGEGQALGQHVRTHLALGKRALRAHKKAAAIEHFTAALNPPPNLGEARHLLANCSDIRYWLGCAHAQANGRAALANTRRSPAVHASEEACRHWVIAAGFKGDFQEMSVRAFSEMTFYSALALRQLGRNSDATKLLRDLLSHARQLARTPATIDYFATSLPTLLLFDDDLDARQKTTALFLEAQARLGLGQQAAARKLLNKVLRRDPNHAQAADLLALPAASVIPPRSRKASQQKPTPNGSSKAASQPDRPRPQRPKRQGRVTRA